MSDDELVAKVLEARDARQTGETNIESMNAFQGYIEGSGGNNETPSSEGESS